MSARERVKALVEEAISLKYQLRVEPTIAYAEERFGDFSTNIAYHLAPKLQKSPLGLATELSGAIKHKDVAHIQPVNGFINIKMTDKFWADQLADVELDYLDNNFGRGQKVQVEFISANPTGPLTLANGRGGYAGDVLANILAICGFETQREYYVNDGGNQIKSLVQSIRNSGTTQPATYKGDYIQELAQALVANKPPIDDAQLGILAVEQVLSRYIKPAVKRMGIRFDNWFLETANLYASDAQPIKNTLALLEKADAVEVKDGAQWLKGGNQSARDRVLTKSDGSYTYLLVDIAYHWHKFKLRGFDRVINLWGADHAGQVASLKEGIQVLGISKPLDVIIFQMVRLIKDSQEVKMSKRAGTYVTIDELLEQIEPDVARWFFLSRDFNTHMDFDLDLATEQSQKNPFYYVMYAYVRALSILSTAQAKGLDLTPAMTTPNPVERAIIRQLSRLPELVVELAQSYEVHKLTFYGVELAQLFHDYYESERIVDLEPAQAGPRLYLIHKLTLAMQAYWALLGIEPKSKM